MYLSRVVDLKGVRWIKPRPSTKRKKLMTHKVHFMSIEVHVHPLN